MKTFIYAERNGSATITLSADTEEEAQSYLIEIVVQPEQFRLETIIEE